MTIMCYDGDVGCHGNGEQGSLGMGGGRMVIHELDRLIQLPILVRATARDFSWGGEKIHFLSYYHFLHTSASLIPIHLFLKAVPF